MVVSDTVPLTGRVIATTNLSHDALPDGYTLSFVPVVPARIGTTKTGCLYPFFSDGSSLAGYRSGKCLKLDGRKTIGHRKIGETAMPSKSEKSTGRSSLPCLLSVIDVVKSFSTMGCRRTKKTRSTIRGDMLRFAIRLCQCVAHDVDHVGEVEQALHP